MKKIRLTLVLLLFVSSLYSQYNKGRLIIGGDLSFSKISQSPKLPGFNLSKTDLTKYTISPKCGYFVMNNLSIGLGLEFTNEVFQNKSLDYSIDSRKTILNFFARYYVPENIFFEASYGVGSGYSKHSADLNRTISDVSQWSASIGYAFFLNDFLAIEPQFGYQQAKLSNSYSSNQIESADVSILVFKLGLQAYLGKRKLD